MKYISTRNKNVRLSAQEVIVKGLSDEGGLFVPEVIPKLTEKDFAALAEMSYEERAAYVLSLFLEDFSLDELTEYCKAAYGRFYGDPCPLVNIEDNLFVLELWHGPTCAFKDMALTLLPHLLTASRKKVGETCRTLILVATSGDTGKAALEGFRDVEGTDVIVFYPSDGVSEMQKLQMITQEGGNVCVCAVKGNFDDAQTAVKNIFADKEIAARLAEKGCKLSSANSINWGRLVPQIAYYVSAYCDMAGSGKIALGDPVNFCVPSGNFGNILAAYYAREMGVPVRKLICASNKNNVLTDFFNTGVYDTRRDFFKTMSPSMDILVSSNLERLLFEICGRDDALIAARMAQLKEKGHYSVAKEELALMRRVFEVGYADEDETADTMDTTLDMYDYLMDPHTAVAAGVFNDYYAATQDETPTVIVSTANAYKFSCDVYAAVAHERTDDAFKAMKKLASFSGEEVPEPLAGLKEREVRFDEVLEKGRIADKVLAFAATRG